MSLARYPDLADRYRIRSVPHLTLEAQGVQQTFSGPQPEPALLARIGLAGTGLA